MKKGLFASLLCVVALSACSTEGTTDYDPGRSDTKDPRFLQTTIKFDHLFHRGTKCPNLGNNCGRRIVTSGMNSEFGNFDAAISSGPTAIGTYFSSTSPAGGWTILFPGLNTEEPGAYSNLSSGNWKVVKSMNGDDIIYFMGPASGTVSESNFVKAAYFEMP